MHNFFYKNKTSQEVHILYSGIMQTYEGHLCILLLQNLDNKIYNMKLCEIVAPLDLL